MAIFVPTPPQAPWWQFWWAQTVLTDHPGCVPPKSSQNSLRSSPFTWTHQGRFWPDLWDLGPVLTHQHPHANFGGSKWYQQTTRMWAHLDPAKSRAPHWQFLWDQRVPSWYLLVLPTDHSACVPPRSSWDPLRSNHLEPKWMVQNGPKWPQIAQNHHKWSDLI